MALPLIVFVIISIVGLITLVLGISNFARDNGISFLIIAAVLFLTTGLFLWTSGLETTTLDHWDLSQVDKITPVYDVITVEDASPLWVVSNAMIVGGAVILIVCLGNTMGTFKLRRVEKEYQREEFF